MNEIIRNIREEDWSHILKIEQARYGNDGYGAYFVRMIPKILSRTCLIALTASGAPVGYALGAIEDVDTTCGWLLSIVVLMEGNGIGTALSQACVERLESLGAYRIRLTVAPENGRARHIYEKLGFVDQGIVKDYYGPCADRHIMERVTR